ncbi:MAG: hypothetical protein ACO3EE_12115 [Flavobacteriales bacterium]
MYDVIFEGKVNSVTKCADGEQQISFSIQDLFKGNYLSVINVKNNCGDGCAMHFEKDDVWLIYAEKNNAQDVIVHFCSRSRKRVVNGEQDDYAFASGLSYQQEKDKLLSFFSVNEEKSNILKPRQYEKVDPSLIPVFLIVSVVFILLAMWAFKKFVK